MNAADLLGTPTTIPKCSLAHSLMNEKNAYFYESFQTIEIFVQRRFHIAIEFVLT